MANLSMIQIEIGETPVTLAVEGRSGIAKGYEGEPENNEGQ